MKLTKRKLKLLIKEGLTRGLSNLQLNEFEIGAKEGEATATDPADGEEKFSGDIQKDLEGIVSTWKPENEQSQEYEDKIIGLIKLKNPAFTKTPPGDEQQGITADEAY